MVKRFFSLLIFACAALAANAQYQITNGDFESDWVNCYPWEKGSCGSTAYGTEPTGWCVSNVPNSLAGTVASQVDGNSGKAVKLTNTSAVGNGIPAYMTLGTTWATAETKMTSTRNKDGGVFGGIPFTRRPDAISLVYQRENSESSTDVSTVVVYTWKGSTSQADVPSNTAVGVLSWGSATKVTMTNRDNNILDVTCNTGGTITKSSDFALLSSTTKTITGAASSWTTLNIPLEYKDATVAPEMMNIVISAAGYQDGGASITDGVSLTVDDVKFVYYHALSALSYDGATINFDENTTSYDLSTVTYDASKLHYTVKGVAATATTSYNEETGLLTITVTGEDGSSTDYTVQFYHKAAPQIVSTKTYTENLYVTVDGVTVGPQEAKIVVDTYDDGTINFTLKNFALDTVDEDTGEPTTMYVGNIALTGIQVESDKTFTFNGNIQIAAGDDPTGVMWYGPYLGDIPLNLTGKFPSDDHVIVKIDISMLGQDIHVHLGYDRATLAVTDAGYATFAAPVDMTIPSGVTAYTVTGVNANNVLVLSDVTGTIPANTAVVLEGSTGETPSYSDFYEPTTETCTTGLLTGVYSDAKAPVGSYILQKNDVVGFFKVAEEHAITANHCYLTKPATSTEEAKAYYFNEADGINTVEANDAENNTIYDLAGRRVSKATKGVYIINGKKVLK